ncbi:MAG: bifunctional diaminohydroxyphosphoribosylaminopyrimidine deaminase/5-amino-6-(5-phosphoribosylamino)uracil reductase RibD [Saprospiraceae bacterium]
MNALDERMMRRCLELALRGSGAVSPNPMVGAVLALGERVLGEGWHRAYGGPHAEVRCFDAVSDADRPLIPQTTLYCNLEPCSHHGKTPPCADLILRMGVRRVVVGCADPNPEVAGKGIARLRASGVAVTEGVLAREARDLNSAFFHWIAHRRPYVILKWAESADGFIARTGERTPISHSLALRLTHRWRAEADAILVGARTALLDDPSLTTRFFPGKNPLRLSLDPRAALPRAARLLDDTAPTWIYGPQREGDWRQTRFIPLETGRLEWHRLLDDLAQAGKAILLVEGGADVHRQWLASGLWNEIRVLSSDRPLGEGTPSAQLPHFVCLQALKRVSPTDTYLRYTKPIEGADRL